MSRRSMDPRLNASLIREGRMIFQQLQQIFGSGGTRVDNVYAMKAAQAQAEADIAKAKAQAQTQAAPALKCAVCLGSDSTTVRDAVTIANGDALCVTHLAKQSQA